jgi:hypothetical protein
MEIAIIILCCIVVSQYALILDKQKLINKYSDYFMKPFDKDNLS